MEDPNHNLSRSDPEWPKKHQGGTMGKMDSIDLLNSLKYNKGQTMIGSRAQKTPSLFLEEEKTGRDEE